MLFYFNNFSYHESCFVFILQSFCFIFLVRVCIWQNPFSFLLAWIGAS